jgi:hypothetical protein
MSVKYLVPCHCGRQWPVETRQAGEIIACSCGQVVDVPTLRGLSALPTVEQKSAGGRGWTKAQGLCFVSAIAWALAGSFVTWWLWSLASRTIEVSPFDQKAEELSARIDDLSPVDSLTYWRMFRDRPDAMLTGPQRLGSAVASNTRTKWVAAAAGVVTVLGTAVLLASMLLGGMKNRARGNATAVNSKPDQSETDLRRGPGIRSD